MTDIPFILWLSEKYIVNNDTFVKNIRIFLKRPYSLEHVIHSIFELSKLEYIDINHQYSIFSINYKKFDRYVYDTLYNNVPPLFNNERKQVNIGEWQYMSN